MNKCLFGDCRDSMRQLIADGVKVQTCATSPPYWGLRDYGVAGQLGLEETTSEYLGKMVEVFRMVRDLLADDGTLWLNRVIATRKTVVPAGREKTASAPTAASPPRETRWQCAK